MFDLPTPPVWFTFLMTFLQESTRDREPFTGGQFKAYWRTLGDLSPEALEQAVQRLAATHEYPTVPTPAAIRRAALDLTESSLTAGEAWQKALAAVRRTGDVTAILASLPPAVADAIRCYGWGTIADSRPGDTTAFAQFRDVFNGLESRRRSEAALPAALRAGAITAPMAPALAPQPSANGTRPTAVAGILNGIGRSA